MMKLATFASFLRLSAALLVLLPLLLIGWAEQAAAHPFHRALSPPLQNEETYLTVQEVSRQVSGRKNKYFSRKIVLGHQTHLEFNVGIKICIITIQFLTLINFNQRLKKNSVAA